MLRLAVVIAAFVLLRRSGILSTYAGAILWSYTLAVGIIADIVTRAALITTARLSETLPGTRYRDTTPDYQASGLKCQAACAVQRYA